jgi:hypothetical protein
MIGGSWEGAVGPTEAIMQNVPRNIRLTVRSAR